MSILEKDLSNFAEAILSTYETSEMSLKRDNAINYLKNEIKNEFTELNENKVKRQRAISLRLGDLMTTKSI